jgi:hypothetical protein
MAPTLQLRGFTTPPQGFGTIVESFEIGPGGEFRYASGLSTI